MFSEVSSDPELMIFFKGFAVLTVLEGGWLHVVRLKDWLVIVPRLGLLCQSIH